MDAGSDVFPGGGKITRKSPVCGEYPLAESRIIVCAAVRREGWFPISAAANAAGKGRQSSP